jgi:hypothetical protein
LAANIVVLKPAWHRSPCQPGKTLPITAANVPPIEYSLGANTLISVGLDGTLRVPD